MTTARSQAAFLRARPAPRKAAHERCAEPGCGALLKGERVSLFTVIAPYHCDGCAVPLCHDHAEHFETARGITTLCSQCVKSPQPKGAA